MYYYLYKITNLVNGKIYIGKHQTKDLDDGYMGSGSNLKKDFEKYGIENFSKEIIEFHDCDRELCLAERKVVNEDFVKREDTYNKTIGGAGTWHHLKNTITVKDKEGNTSRVSINDPKYLSGELMPIWKNMICVKDKEGKKFLISKDDPRYLSGEVVHTTTGFIIAKDKTGNIFQVKKDDYRFLTGELTGHSFGNIMCKDKEGKLHFVKKDDPRYTTGELIRASVWSGRKHKPETNLKRKQTMAERKHAQGEKNSHYGKVWMYNLQLKKSISIKKEEVEKFLSEGWIKGRKIKFQ